jgi:lipoyl(octanoyl) transferase
VKPLRSVWLGRQAYQPTWDLQERTRDRILAGDPSAETIYFVEHDPVITLGRSARPEHILRPHGIDVVRTSRGGDVTVHGPGQLVIYPVVTLRRGVVDHVESIGRAIADEIDALGAGLATWRRDPAGVWIGSDKIAACGIHIRRRVAVHGFALNVTAETRTLFDRIIPCGLPGVGVVSLADRLANDPPPLDRLARSLAERIATAIGRRSFFEPIMSIESCDRLPSR